MDGWMHEIYILLLIVPRYALGLAGPSTTNYIKSPYASHSLCSDSQIAWRNSPKARKTSFESSKDIVHVHRGG
jgi:hypothetical protein